MTSKYRPSPDMSFTVALADLRRELRELRERVERLEQNQTTSTKEVQHEDSHGD
jgi:hypothetical protein